MFGRIKINEWGMIADFSDVLNRHKCRNGTRENATPLRIQIDRAVAIVRLQKTKKY